MKTLLTAAAFAALAASAQAQMPQQDPVRSDLPQQQTVPSAMPNANGTSGAQQHITPQGTTAGTTTAPVPTPPQTCRVNGMNEACVPPMPPCLPNQQRLPGTNCPPNPNMP